MPPSIEHAFDPRQYLLFGFTRNVQHAAHPLFGFANAHPKQIQAKSASVGTRTPGR